MSDRREEATLLDVLVDGFEKNEVMDGCHWRQLPMPDERAAVEKFASLTEEAKKWKGPPERHTEHHGRRVATWDDLEIRQAGRGVLVLARAPRFASWWHARATWEDDPLGPIYTWLREEREARERDDSR